MNELFGFHMHSQTPQEKPPGFWSSLFTDEASFPRAQFNFWATAETILAICGFWVVALRWETFFLLYSSLAIAPLLFLRSDAAVAQGVDWFQNGFFPPRWPDDPKERATDEKRLVRRWAWIGAAIGLCVAIGGGWPAAKYFLAGQEGWAAFLRGLVCGFGVYSAAAAVVIATAAAGVGAVAIRAVGAGAGAGVGAAALAGAAAGVVAGVVVPPQAVAVSLPGMAFGVWLHSLVLRFLATFRHLADGYRAMPTNIRRLTCFIAPLHPPELLPGLPEGHKARFGGFFASGKAELASPKGSDKIFGCFWLLMLPIWFAPGWLYRIILKSTLWLWWILLFLGGAPNVAGGVVGLKADYQKIWVRFVLVAAGVYIGVFLFANFFKPFVSNQFSGAPLLPILAVLFLIDWRSLPVLPLLGVLASGLTIGAWWWADSLVQDSTVPGREDKVSRGVGRLAHFIQWKTAIGVAAIALLMLYVAFHANARLGLWPLSDWLFSGLSWLYGENADALL